MRLIFYLFLISQLLNFLNVFAQKVIEDSSELNSIKWEKVEEKSKSLTAMALMLISIPVLEAIISLCAFIRAISASPTTPQPRIPIRISVFPIPISYMSETTRWTKLNGFEEKSLLVRGIVRFANPCQL